GAAARADRIRVRVAGATRLGIDSNGNLEMQLRHGTIVQTRPRFFEVIGSRRKEIKGSFLLYGSQEYGFAVTRSVGSQLLIDPEIVFASYFGGGSNEGTLEVDQGASDLHGQGFDIALDRDGKVVVVGTTASTDFPLTSTGSLQGSTDVFVVKLDMAGSPAPVVDYAVVLGGSSFERGVAVSPDDLGNVYV